LPGVAVCGYHTTTRSDPSTRKALRSSVRVTAPIWHRAGTATPPALQLNVRSSPIVVLRPPRLYDGTPSRFIEPGTASRFNVRQTRVCRTTHRVPAKRNAFSVARNPFAVHADVRSSQRNLRTSPPEIHHGETGAAQVISFPTNVHPRSAISRGTARRWRRHR